MIKNGIDIVEIKRIEKALEKHKNFVERIFTTREIEYIRKKNFRAETVAGMCAAKEAFSKYLGTGFSAISFMEIEILHDDIGKPYVMFKGRRSEADLSISHSNEDAVAVVTGNCPLGANISAELLMKMRALLPVRKSDSHKGDFGRVFILGGSEGMTGAVCLSAMGALRSGAGLVTVGSPYSQRGIVAVKLTEAMTVGYDDSYGMFTGSDAEKIIKRVNSSDVCGLGMGMGRCKGVDNTVYEIVKNAEKPLVIDADGINAISWNIDILKKLNVNAVLTPHPGEMMRLTGKMVGRSLKSRINTALEVSARYNVVTVLKGQNTVIAAPNGEYTVNSTGNSGMATGGSGDVLTGIIASFIGQGLSVYDAAVLSVYLHGRAGDMAANELGTHGLIASDLVKKLPLAIKELSF